MFNKTSTRLPEALLYVFHPQHSRSWQMSKLGHLVDPLNVLLNGSQYQHGAYHANLTWISPVLILSGYDLTSIAVAHHYTELCHTRYCLFVRPSLTDIMVKWLAVKVHDFQSIIIIIINRLLCNKCCTECMHFSIWTQQLYASQFLLTFIAPGFLFFPPDKWIS